MRNPVFGVELVPTTNVQNIAELAIMAESIGINYVWVTDHYVNRNVYITLTYIVTKTNHIRVGVGITNPYVIHPVWTASAIATLNELSNGRVVLGIGAGDKTILESIGIKREKPLIAVKEAVTIIRKLINGEAVTFNGEVFKVPNARLNYKPKSPIPIYIGAQAPKMLELAGALGDGVLINASNPILIEKAISCVRNGVEKSNRDLKSIDIAVCTCFSISKDLTKAKSAVRPVIAFVLASSPEDVIEKSGIDYGKVEQIVNYLSKGDVKSASKIVDDHMIDYFSITGTLEDCILKIEEIFKKGVTQLVVGSPIGPKKEESLELVKQIISKFK